MILASGARQLVVHEALLMTFMDLQKREGACAVMQMHWMLWTCMLRSFATTRGWRTIC